MVDRFELEPRFEWLHGSRYYDEALGDAALAIELTSLEHGDEMMRHGCAWMSAAGVVEVLGLEELVESVRRRRAAGERWPESFGAPPPAATIRRLRRELLAEREQTQEYAGIHEANDGEDPGRARRPAA